ncbi:MAG: YlbF family regulator [Planctomycetota bacterium]|nr:YlbF family regulator [Planctomycetota bacterium]
MSAVTELAERLGKAIADSPAATNLRDARKAVNQQPELEKLLKDFQQQSERIAQMEQENKPVEVEDKRKLQELHGELIASDVFKKYTAAQVEYVDLMRKVNEAIGRQISDTEQ